MYGNIGDYHLNYFFLDKPLQLGDIKLYQAGELFCNENTAINAHTHLNWFELTAVTAGSGVITADATSVSVEKGDVYLSFPYEIHSIQPDKKHPLKFYFLSFYCENEDYKKDFDYILHNFSGADKRIINDSKISRIISDILSEFSFDKLNRRRQMTEHLLYGLIISIIRGFSHLQPEEKLKNVSNKEILCHRVMSYIDNNVLSIKNLEEISIAFNYNYSYISNLFKKTTKQTITEYFTARKLKMSEALIREKKLSITQIAELLNYASVYSFSKAFKNRYGISPALYRKNN